MLFKITSNLKILHESETLSRSLSPSKIIFASRDDLKINNCHLEMEHFAAF